MAVNGDDNFEHELRSTLREMAPDRAPERLVARVDGIPRREPHVTRSGLGIGLGFRQFASAAAAIAVVLIIGVAAILVRGGSGPSVGGPSAPPASIPAASVPASATAAQATPAAATTPTPASTATPVPAGFSPVSVTFVSPDQGFVLGSVSCEAGGSTCTSIARTADAGRTWSSMPGPATSIAGAPVEAAGSGVSGIRFADRLDGWAFGPELWATHDGGLTWRQLTIAGVGSQTHVVALEAGNGLVHAVLYDDSQPRFRIASASITSDQWQLSPVSIAIGAGPVPMVQLVLTGASGWVLENDRTVVGGARLVNGQWQSWKPACSDTLGPAVLAASSSTHLVAACNVGLWATPQGERLYVSNDGGATFSRLAPQIPIDVQEVASGTASTIVAAGSGSSGSQLVASFDGGATWQRLVQRTDALDFADLGFTTPTQGVLVETPSQGGTGRLLMTRDGGHSWQTVSFAATAS